MAHECSERAAVGMVLIRLRPRQVRHPVSRNTLLECKRSSVNRGADPVRNAHSIEVIAVGAFC